MKHVFTRVWQGMCLRDHIAITDEEAALKFVSLDSTSITECADTPFGMSIFVEWLVVLG